MQEKRFIISEEPYKIGTFEQAPIAEKDTAIVLYRRENGAMNGILIEYGKQILAGTVRKQRCNTKVVVDKKPIQISFCDKVKTKEGFCDFIVNIKAELVAKDILQIVSENKEAPCNEIEREIRTALRREDGKHSLDREYDLRDKIFRAYDDIKMRYPYVYMTLTESIELDENGKKYVSSERETIVKSRIIQNENRISKEQMANFQEVYQKYGDDILLIESALAGEMSKMELHGILRKQKKEDRREAVDLYFKALNEGAIGMEQAEQFTEKYVFAQTTQNTIAENKRAAIEEIVIDDTDTY